jgi:D-xylose transport system substrate-binding protein
MAPEMVYRGGVTPLIDVYALGVTLFQALAGEPPYEADTPMGTALAHTTQPIPQIGDWNPDLPAGIQAVIEGALAKDPADRYQSAGALAADLRGIASQGQPLPVLETTPVESPPEPTIQEPSPPAALEVTLPDAPPEMPEVTLPDVAPAAPTPAAAQQTAVPRATPLPPAVVKPVSRRFPVWLVAVLGLVIVAGLAFAFWPRGGGSAGEPPAEEPVAEQPTVGELAGEPVGEPIKVGLSFADFANERWQNEEILMRGMLEDLGYEVLSQEASQDAQLQNDQIDNMVAQGVEALIVIPEDGDAIVTATDRAAEAGVIVLAYDRLIKSPNIAAYVSFNNVEVGRQQALGVMEALDIENWDVAANGPARVVKLGGSPTDNNAILFRRGQDEILDPLVDEGKIEIVADQWVDNWDAAIAQGLMEDILAAAGNDIDAVVASNDYTALGALQALRARGLAGKVPISGQDATADGCNSIARGELTVTILKDIRDLSPLAVNLVDRLLKGETVELENYSLAGLTNDESLSGEVPCRFLPVYQVNADNVYELVVKSGFQAYGDVYRDIPAGDRPPRP